MSEEDFDLETEREDMERLRTLRRIAFIIFRKYALPAVLSAVIVFVCALLLVANRVRKAPDRYEAVTSLIYCPKQNTKIRTMDNQEVLRVLSRHSVLTKLSDAMQLSVNEATRLRSDIGLDENNRQRNLYTLTARAPTEEQAIKKVNVYADLCMKEYVSYRMADLETWMDTILVRKKELQDQVSRLEEKEGELSRKYGVSAPESEADRMTRVIGDRRSALVEARLHLASAELKKKKVELELGKISPNVVENADAVRAYLDRQIKNEESLAEVRHVYGENNPRYRIAVERRDSNLTEFKDFLTKHGIKDANGISFTRYAALQEELKDAEAKVELAKQSIEALDHERETLEEKLRALLGVLPEFERLSRQRDNLRQTLDGLEDTLADVRYLESTSGADLTQIEPAHDASGRAPFGNKSIVFAFLLMLIVVGGAMGVAMIFEFHYGVISGADEISIHPEIRALGSLPMNDDFKDEVTARKVCGGIFYLYHRECSKGLVYVGMLSGAQWSRSLESAFKWNFGMSGEKAITLNLINSIEFVEPEGAEYVGVLVKSGSEVWLPVTDVTSLSPGEMEMLESSVKLLREEYDTVFLRRKEPLRRGEIFLAQIFGICDRVLLFAGAKRSRRGDLQMVLETPRRDDDAEILAVVTCCPTEDGKKGGA